MTLFAMSPEWNDFFAVGGFVVGVVGFAVTFWQIVKTKRAIVASRDAAAGMFNENRSSFERFIGDYASRLVSELQDCVSARKWELAKIRAHDLAELFATLQDSGNSTTVIVAELRVFGQVFSEKINRANAAFDRVKYGSLLGNVQRRLDTLRAPFRGVGDGEKNEFRDSPGEVPADRGDALGENKSRAGELGSDTKGGIKS